jgi:hypothetical protein
MLEATEQSNPVQSVSYDVACGTPAISADPATDHSKWDWLRSQVERFRLIDSPCDRCLSHLRAEHSAKRHSLLSQVAHFSLTDSLCDRCQSHLQRTHLIKRHGHVVRCLRCASAPEVHPSYSDSMTDPVFRCTGRPSRSWTRECGSIPRAE